MTIYTGEFSAEELELHEAGARYVKEYQRWGFCPTYILPDGTLRFVMEIETTDGAETRIFTGERMYEYLKRVWRPQSREDQDWFVVHLAELKTT